MDTPSPGTRVRAKLKNFLNSKMTKARGADLSDSPSGAGFPPPGPEGDSPAVDALHAELAEEKRKRALIAREAAETEEVVRNALTAANARVEDVEARRLELSAELRAAQAASQIFEKERFGIMKKLEDSRVEKSSLEQRVEELTRQVENLERERESKGGGGREAPAEETEGEDDARRLDMLSKLASSPASSDAAIRALTAEKDELAALLETEKQKKGEILEKLESFEEKMVEVQKEKQEIEDRKNAILAKLEEFEEKMAEMQRERDDAGNAAAEADAALTAEKDELASELEAEKQKKSEILAKLEEFEEKMVDVQREKQEIEDRKNEILARLESFEEEVGAVQRDKVGQLETSLADERAKSESLQKSIVDLADEMASLNEAFTKLERERDAHARRAEDEGVTEQSKIKVDLDVERKTNEDLKKELRDCLAGKHKLEEENQDRKDEIAVLEKLLQAERAAAASNASRKKKGLFGRK